MSASSRGRTVIHRIRTGPRWRVVVILVIVAVLVYGVYSAWESSQANGKRLDKALGALAHSNATNDQLVLVIRAQSGQIDGMRLALKKLGLSDAQINKAISAAGGNPSTPALPPGVGPTGPQGPRGHNGHDGGGGGHPRPHPSNSPSHSPEPSPEPSPTPTCRVVNPLTGKCIVHNLLSPPSVTVLAAYPIFLAGLR